jgi:hypothetical protein
MFGSSRITTVSINRIATVLFLAISPLGIAQTLVTTPSAQNFGQTTTSAPVTETLTYVSTGTSNPAFSLAYGTEYSLGIPHCTAGASGLTCALSVSFQPCRPGLRQDAVIVKNASGATLATTFLYGIGLAPQATLLPGIITTVAGTGVWGYGGDGAIATGATLRNPQGIASDQAGNLYIADSINQVVRMVNPKGQISTLVGTGLAGYTGDGGPAAKASLNTPTAVALDGAGNLYIADQGNNVIRKVWAGTEQICTIAGGGTGFSGADSFGDGAAAIGAILSGPNDVAVDGAGNLFIADSFNGLVRKVAAGTGIITVAAGGGTSAGVDGFGNGGAATSARLRNPLGIGLDVAGNLYIADTGNSMVRKVDVVSGVITAVAGTGQYGYSGDKGSALNAALASPAAVRADAAGNIYLADQAKNVIRQVSAIAGTISTIAGTGAHRYSGDGGSPLSASLADPAGLALDANGNLFIADFSNNTVREILLTAGWPVTFPTTLLGQASAPQVLSVMNTGNQPLNFTQVNLPAGFVQQPYSGSDCSLSSNVPAGGVCTISIAFAPTKLGAMTGTVGLTTNAPGMTGTLSIAVSGAGAPGAVPNVALSSTTIAFGNQPIGVATTPSTISLSNSGQAPLQISSITLSGLNTSDFAVTTTCQGVVAAGASCSISVIFQPTVVGSRNAVVTLLANVANLPQITLTGTGLGLPQLSLSSSAVQFGSATVGGTGAARTINLSNTGSGTLLVTGIALSGTRVSDFTMTTTCGTSLSAGGVCSISVNFLPRGFGLRTAALTLFTNAAASPQSIALNGMAFPKAVPAVWRPSNGTWYISQNGSSPTQWGLTGDIPVPGDYDGDGKIDFAVFRPANGYWYIVPSSAPTTFRQQQWGLTGDIPVPGDYDGDGKTDLAVFRPGNGYWYIVPSSAPTTFRQQQWGLTGDIPAPGDYDGDGKTDLAVFRPGNGYWYIVPSSTPTTQQQQWGLPGDIPVPGDYDGDGKTDLAVFRPASGYWYIVPSSAPTTFRQQQWGLSGDIPVAGDYDGDGKTDLAVFRPGNNYWYIVPSSAPTTQQQQQWGLSGDRPVTPSP